MSVSLSVERSLALERHVECLRKRLLDLNKAGSIPPADLAIKWSVQAAKGLTYLKEKGVLQEDISSGNLLLDEHDNIKYCDFAGSSIDGTTPSVCCGLDTSVKVSLWTLHLTSKTNCLH